MEEGEGVLRESRAIVVAKACLATFLLSTYVDDCNKDCDVCIRLYLEEFVLINKIEKEVDKKFDSCQIQKNVNMTIKYGLRNVNIFIKEVKVKHMEVSEKDMHFYYKLTWSEELHQE